MRKLSLLSILLVSGLVVGLVGNVAFAGQGGGWGDNTNTVSFAPSGVMKMKIKSGDDVQLGNFDPREDQDFGDKTEIKVVSNKSWTISKSLSVDTAPDGADEHTVKDKLGVSLGEDGGDKGKTTFDVSYSWTKLNDNELEKVPQGDYTIEITYTLGPA